MSVQKSEHPIWSPICWTLLSSHACTQACVLRQGVNHSFAAHLLSLYLSYFLSFFHLVICQCVSHLISVGFFVVPHWHLPAPTPSNVWTSFVLPSAFQRSIWTPHWFSPVCFKAHPTGTQRQRSCLTHWMPRYCATKGEILGKGSHEQRVWDVLLRAQFKLQPHPEDSRHLTLRRRKSQFREAGLVPCTSTGSSGAMCLAARRPQVSFNCVSNWLLPMQLLPVSHSIFHGSGKGPGGTFCSEGQDSYRHIWVPNVEHEEAYVKLKSGAGHQWHPALIDCCVRLLWSRESENFTADIWGWEEARPEFTLL